VGRGGGAAGERGGSGCGRVHRGGPQRDPLQGCSSSRKILRRFGLGKLSREDWGRGAGDGLNVGTAPGLTPKVVSAVEDREPVVAERRDDWRGVGR